MNSVSAVALFITIELAMMGHCVSDDRSGQGLTSIPTDLDSSSAIVNLGSNNIVRIPRDSFRELSVCQILYLYNDKISAIEQGAFNGLVSLEELDLNGNKLTTVLREWWQGAESITSLHLGRNEISTMRQSAFSGLVNLVKLRLDRNKLKTVLKEWWVGLESLTYLNLGLNEIRSINAGAFSTLPKLKSLILSSNRITKPRPEMFTGMNSLQSLELANNSIRLLDPKTFSEIPDTLTTVNLYLNDICTFPPGMFDNRAKVPQLIIDANPIQCDSNLCWLVNVQETATHLNSPDTDIPALIGYDIYILANNCKYVENYDENCLEINPQAADINQCQDASASTSTIMSSGLLGIVAYITVSTI